MARVQWTLAFLLAPMMSYGADTSRRYLPMLFEDDPHAANTYIGGGLLKAVSSKL